MPPAHVYGGRQPLTGSRAAVNIDHQRFMGNGFIVVANPSDRNGNAFVVPGSFMSRNEGLNVLPAPSQGAFYDNSPVSAVSHPMSDNDNALPPANHQATPAVEHQVNRTIWEWRCGNELILISPNSTRCRQFRIIHQRLNSRLLLWCHVQFTSKHHWIQCRPHRSIHCKQHKSHRHYSNSPMMLPFRLNRRHSMVRSVFNINLLLLRHKRLCREHRSIPHQGKRHQIDHKSMR